MDLREFVAFIQTQPLPIGVVADDQIVEGLSRLHMAWSAEQIAAEAFNQDVLPFRSVTWESALAQVRAILAGGV